jgi:protein-arginine kinase activator protein McsA
MNMHHALISTLQYDSSVGRAEADYDEPELNFAMLKWLQSLPPLLHSSYRSCFNDGWNIYDPEKEFKRMSIPDKYWRITHANSSYEVCDTYPAVLAVPAAVNDAKLGLAALFRSRGRLPALSWRHPRNFCSITRSSQPLVGMQKRQSAEDEALLAAINQAAQGPIDDFQLPMQPRKNFRGVISSPFVIFDARPKLNATANQAAGKGYEMSFAYKNCNLIFMNIDNIHVMRKSLDALEDHCRTPVTEDPNWYSQVEGSGWLTHVNRVLVGAVRLVHCICKEQLSVLVHCSDGWDRTAELTSLAMLMMDPFYRTYLGFQTLIEKEWLSFGHKFGDRLGWSDSGWSSQERSPVFMQFLDCVHQLLRQNPAIFEFNEELLIFIMHQTQSAWFGNFLLNSEKDRKTLRLSDRTMSLWSYVLMNFSCFGNAHYTPSTSDVWVPVTSIRKTVLWEKWFLKWHDVVWKNEWNRKNEDFSELDGTELPSDVTAHSDVHECYECQHKFTLFLRRNHCFHCKNVFCEECLVSKPDVHGKAHLYCRNCFDVYEEQINSELTGISQNVLMHAGMTRRVLGSASNMTLHNRMPEDNLSKKPTSRQHFDEVQVVTNNEEVDLDCLPPLTKKQWLLLDEEERSSYVQDEETSQYVDIKLNNTRGGINHTSSPTLEKKSSSFLGSLSSKFKSGQSPKMQAKEDAWASQGSGQPSPPPANQSKKPQTAPPNPPSPSRGPTKKFIPFSNAMMTKSAADLAAEQDTPPPLAKKYSSTSKSSATTPSTMQRSNSNSNSHTAGGGISTAAPHRSPPRRQTFNSGEQLGQEEGDDDRPSSRSPPRQQADKNVSPPPSRGPRRQSSNKIILDRPLSRTPPRRQESSHSHADDHRERSSLSTSSRRLSGRQSSRDSLLKGEAPPPPSDQQISIIPPEEEADRLRRKSSSAAPNRFDVYKSKNSVDLSRKSSRDVVGRRTSGAQEETHVRRTVEEDAF